MLPYSKLADEPRSEDECIRLLWRIMTPLAALEFGTVPVVYLLGRLDKISVAHDVIAGLYVVVAVMKVAALRFLRGPRGSDLRRAYEDAIVAPEKLPVVGTELCCWPKGFTLFFTTIPTYCETQATALAIGAAARTWSPCEQAYWEASWANTPGGVLAFVGWMTLPTVLGLMLFLHYIAHIVILALSYADRDGVDWVSAESLSTTSGLMMIAAVCRESGRGLRSQLTDFNRILCKLVFGTGPRLWLKISLLGILMQSTTDTAAVGAARLAVCMSFFHAFQVLWATRARMKEGWPILLIPVFVPLLMCMVRFAGTSLCDSHVFNLSTASCVDLHECSS